MLNYFRNFSKDYKWKQILVFILTTPFIGILLYQIFLFDDVLYHTISELITIFVGLLIIVILISMWRHIKSNILISIICISVFFTGVIDIFHVLAFTGYNNFSTTVTSFDLTLTFWIYSRMLQASGILFAIILARFFEKVNYKIVFLLFFTATFIGIVFTLRGYFPQMYNDGIGITTSKIVNEFIILLLFILSGYLIYIFRLVPNKNMLSLFYVFLLFQIISEFYFTQYTLSTDNAFIIGHHFKIVASLIIGYILLKSTIIAPSESMYKEIRHQSVQLSKLLKYEKLTREITEICSSAIDNSNFIQDVLKLFGKTLEVDHTFIYKHIEERGTFKLVNWWFNISSQFSEADDGYEFFVVEPLLEKFKEGITHYCSDTSTLENKWERDNFINIGIYAYINEPLFLYGEFYGFMGYNMTSTNRETLEDDITLIRSISKILTQTIERTEAFKEIEYLSIHDDLTGSFNRRHFEKFIDEIDNKSYYPLGIVAIDLNGLKLINDAFGHLAGDQMLLSAVDLLEKNLKGIGTVFRVGGDEFVVLIPKTDSEAIYHIFADIVKQCSNVFVSSVQLSLSYGVYVRTSNTAPFYEEFKIAEDEMYRMKLMDVPSMRTNAIETILNTLFEKDEYSKDHCTNVSLMVEVLAQKMGFNSNQVNDIKMAGLLHDIGKIIVPTHILKKDGKLTNMEYSEIKNHAEIGFRILSSTKDFRQIANYVLSHHEFYNGKGYPHGIEGEAIPIESRIITVIDAYDAMVSYRSYRENITQEQAILELKNNSGSQFDPKIVDVFLKHIDEITKVRLDK